ncbi:unnamed protein product [Blepharisma stoltei]|uniref:Uncharacterized protein n=1 Tax=Blepharisma stoltei TaxID=1481888 RepID=A0AAU9J6N9_9CILI|nr:unnamed protein product [Blepharisma stoltei]
MKSEESGCCHCLKVFFGNLCKGSKKTAVAQEVNMSSINPKLEKSTFELSMGQLSVKDINESLDKNLPVIDSSPEQSIVVRNSVSYKSNIITGNSRNPLYSAAPPLSYQSPSPKPPESKEPNSEPSRSVENPNSNVFQSHDSEVSNEVLFYDKNTTGDTPMNKEQVKQNLEEAYNMIKQFTEEDEISPIAQNFLSSEEAEPDEISIPKRSDFTKVVKGINFKAILADGDIPNFLESKKRIY